MNKKGFTLIELLIVVAIIGIIAAIAIPNLLIALQKGKQKATMGDLKSIGTAIESYITDWAISPASNPCAGGGAAWFEPFYIKICPQADGWGHGWGYVAGTSSAPDDYSIYSQGRGGLATAAALAIPAINPYICTSLGDFAFDICFSDGYFTVGPDVKK
jgi:prepilin-type N-terminal cleavage/methylation domain-containing protein